MRTSSFFLFIILLAGSLFVGDIYYNRIYKPCGLPLVYTIGFVDPRQSVTQEQLTSLLKKAEAVWEDPSGKNLFSPETTDTFFDTLRRRKVTVNVRYDERQERKNALANSARELDTEAQKLAYEKAQLNTLQNQFLSEQKAYEQRVAEWNAGKRSSQSAFKELTAARVALEQFKKTVDEKIAAYNKSVSGYNTSVNSFNSRSHWEGEAGTTRGRAVIDLYVLDGNDTDVFLIAHELGHALGIDEHSPDESALMYYRLPKDISRANDSDMTLLTKACKW